MFDDKVNQFVSLKDKFAEYCAKNNVLISPPVNAEASIGYNIPNKDKHTPVHMKDMALQIAIEEAINLRTKADIHADVHIISKQHLIEINQRLMAAHASFPVFSEMELHRIQVESIDLKGNREITDPRNGSSILGKRNYSTIATEIQSKIPKTDFSSSDKG